MTRDDRPGPLVVVHWVDIRGDAGWSDEWRPDGDLARCIEVGYLTSRKGGKLTLVRGCCDAHDHESRFSGARVTIPLSCVRLIQRIEEPYVEVPW